MVIMVNAQWIKLMLVTALYIASSTMYTNMFIEIWDWKRINYNEFIDKIEKEIIDILGAKNAPNHGEIIDLIEKELNVILRANIALNHYEYMDLI